MGLGLPWTGGSEIKTKNWWALLLEHPLAVIGYKCLNIPSPNHREKVISFCFFLFLFCYRGVQYVEQKVEVEVLCVYVSCMIDRGETNAEHMQRSRRDPSRSCRSGTVTIIIKTPSRVCMHPNFVFHHDQRYHHHRHYHHEPRTTRNACIV